MACGCAQPLGIRAVIVTDVGYSGVSVAEARDHMETWAYWPDMGEGIESTCTLCFFTSLSVSLSDI